MPGGSKQTTKSNSTQNLSAYAPARPGIDGAVRGITDWQNSPQATAVYQGPRSVDMSATTRQGLADYANVSGSRDAANYMRGLFTNSGQPNPYMDQLLESVTASTRPGINAAFSNAGMSGSTQHQGVMARELARATAPHLFGAFENQQNRAFQAAQLFPGMDERLGQRQIEAGQIGEGYDREKMAGDQAKFQEEKFAGLLPYTQTLPLLQNVGAQFGTQTGRSTQTSKTDPSLGQSILGGGMMLGSLFTGGGPMAGMMGGMGSLFGGGGTRYAPTGSYAPGLPWAPRGA